MAAALAGALSTSTPLQVDASAPAPAPEVGRLRMGSSVAPGGGVLAINSRFLTRDGRPWLPVMGEFHYSRFPADGWDEELAKIRAAGVDVVATYVIWNHHEESEGRFDWSGDRDLRRFIQLCARHGLLVMLRVGPWDHAEVRFGGTPDWVVHAMPTRGDDPTYLKYVARLYDAIGAQAKGLLWKDGGPVIGVQLENEYNLTGLGRGATHIATLKRLAISAGLDAPLYTVTGWDQAVYPRGEVAPVFGGYPDLPWGDDLRREAPAETYLFRFDSRVAGDLGAQTKAAGTGDADADAAHTPFLGAEYAGGLPLMYRRRTVVSPDDIAAMLPVQLGSGVNLYGYYMFHGGRNPKGATTLEESTALGGYNDLPLINYDFQAPFGEYGQAHPVLGRLRPWHAFLQTFGDRLAPMTVHRPAHTPDGPADLQTPRWSVRSAGDSGFLFFNNHVRLHDTPAHRAVQFDVRLAHASVRLPSRPVDIPADAFFMWPIGMNLDGARLAWATAQPVTRLDDEGPVYVFGQTQGVPVEFAFDPAGIASVEGATRDESGRWLLRAPPVGGGRPVRVRLTNGTGVRLMVLDPEEMLQAQVMEIAGRRRLLLTRAQTFLQGAGVTLRGRDPHFDLRVFPAPAGSVTGDLPLGADRLGVFRRFKAQAAPRRIPVTVRPLRPAGAAAPIGTGGPAKAAVEPAPERFGASAAWTLSVPPEAVKDVADAWLKIDYRGDVGRLFSGVELLDDDFYAGGGWEVALKRFADRLNAPLTLTVLPLRADAPIYLEEGARPNTFHDGQVAEVLDVKIEPEYRLHLALGR